ncbi:transcriptional regulator [Salmonella enterica subsp. enterica]|nr:transcriptional regulator [Salmonella enterica subsp. enterica]
MKAAIARISMRTPVAAANTVTDTAVVVMDRAVVDVSDFLAHGELRLVILDILTRDASHGYELIKAIENLTGGGYTPSAGVIYPTLDFLQDQQFITISDEEGGAEKNRDYRERRAMA